MKHLLFEKRNVLPIDFSALCFKYLHETNDTSINFKGHAEFQLISPNFTLLIYCLSSVSENISFILYLKLLFILSSSPLYIETVYNL